MSKDKFKLILFTIGFIIFVAMLFSGNFVSTNVIKFYYSQETAILPQ